MKISIGKAAKLLGVSKDTLRRWEKDGKIHSERTFKGHRRYEDTKILGFRKGSKLNVTLGYARVSSHDQKQDLQRQVELLESYCSAKGLFLKFYKIWARGLTIKKKV